MFAAKSLARATAQPNSRLAMWRLLSTVDAGGLKVDESLYELVNERIAPGTGVDPASFWASLNTIVADLVPENKELLAKRDEIQLKLDAYHKENPGAPTDMAAYKAFLTEIGYLVPEGEDFDVSPPTNSPI